MNKIKSIKDILGKIQYILTEKQKKQSIYLVIVIIFGSFLEMLGVSAILPFINAILTPKEVMQKWYVNIFTTIFNIQDSNTVVVIIGILIICVYIIKNIYLYLSTILQVVFRSKIEKDLSTKMLKAYMKRDYEYYVNSNTALIMRWVGGDVAGVYELLNNVFRFLGEMFTAILISGYIIYTDAFMAICIIAIAGICFTSITFGLKKKLKYLGEQRRLTIVAREKCAYQSIMGFKEIKVTQATKHFIKSYDEAYENQRLAEVKNEKIVNLPEKIIESVCVAALIGVICVKIAMGADMTNFIPKLGAFAVAAFRLLPSVSRMTRYINGVMFNTVNLNNVYNMLKEIDNFREEDKSVEKENQEKIRFTNSIEIKDLDWVYQGNEKKILSGLSLEINKGESIGLIGQSGAGKSTLADSILGLLKPKKGKIMVDGVDVYSDLQSWSRVIGYVPQSVFLADDTIRNNVAFGIDFEEIKDEDVWNALEQAQLKEFVEQLPEGLDTQVGERGIKFSGGQRQRVAIARALYHDPDIIVLDEATSALDNDTEKAVMEAIDALQGKKTLIIVAHRLTTIKNCTKIFAIENGKAIEKTYASIRLNNDKEHES